MVARHVLGWGAHLLGVEIPSQLAPIMIVLILGVVTDYSVFTLTGVRARLGGGRAAEHRAAQFVLPGVPLVIAAALTVAAGTIALIGANLDFFPCGRARHGRRGDHLGARSISFVPALVGVLGRLTFWPHLPRRPAEPVHA